MEVIRINIILYWLNSMYVWWYTPVYLEEEEDSVMIVRALSLIKVFVDVYKCSNLLLIILSGLMLINYLMLDAIYKRKSSRFQELRIFF